MKNHFMRAIFKRISQVEPFPVFTDTLMFEEVLGLMETQQVSLSGHSEKQYSSRSRISEVVALTVDPSASSDSESC